MTWPKRIITREAPPTISNGNKRRAHLIINGMGIALIITAFLMAIYLILKVIA